MEQKILRRVWFGERSHVEFLITMGSLWQFKEMVEKSLPFSPLRAGICVLFPWIWMDWLAESGTSDTMISKAKSEKVFQLPSYLLRHCFWNSELPCKKFNYPKIAMLWKSPGCVERPHVGTLTAEVKTQHQLSDKSLKIPLDQMFANFLK